MMKKCLLLVTVLLSFFPSLACAEWQAYAVDAYDGDTLIVSRGGRAEIIRLYGIDCPEMDQPFGLEAKSHTSNLVIGKTIKVISVDRARYERGVVYVGDTCVNRELVKAGYAWHAGEDPLFEEWGKLEQRARSQEKGLWLQEDPVPPWEFRAADKYEAALDQSYTIEMRGKHKSFRARAVRGRGGVYRQRRTK
ncbi:MAG: thermonuclease family protein [Desulfobacteraceae bacterium]|jgi:endonuclease YncB( thermonuclease family)